MNGEREGEECVEGGRREVIERDEVKRNKKTRRHRRRQGRKEGCVRTKKGVREVKITIDRWRWIDR